MAEEVYVSFETGGDNYLMLGEWSYLQYWQGFRFIIAADITCTSASFYINTKNGNPTGDITFRIETLSDDDRPSGTLVHANATGTVAFADIVVGGWNKCSFTKFALPAGNYALIVYIPDQAMFTMYQILCDADGVGCYYQSTNHGATWGMGYDWYIGYYRIYREVAVTSKFRDEICFRGLPGGFAVRGSINKEYIYAVKNNQQRKYAYFVPTNPQTVDQQAWRAKFTAGVAAALILTDEQKDEYRKDAYRKKGQTWFTRFMTQYLWAESHS